MKLDTNDPRITAYILDELDADERAKFEKEIEGCEESQAYIEEMRGTADLLSVELGREMAPALASSQREKIEANLNGKANKGGFARWLFDWRVGVLVPAAACALLVFLVFPVKKDSSALWQEQHSTLARKPQPAEAEGQSYQIASAPEGMPEASKPEGSNRDEAVEEFYRDVRRHEVSTGLMTQEDESTWRAEMNERYDALAAQGLVEEESLVKAELAIPDIRNEVDGAGASNLNMDSYVIDPDDREKEQVALALGDSSPAPTSTPAAMSRVVERPQIVELASGASPSSPKPVDSIIYRQSSALPSLQQEGGPLARAASTSEFSRNLGDQTGAQVGKETKPVPIGAAISEGLAESSKRSSESEYFGWDVDADTLVLSKEVRDARAYNLGYESGSQRVAGDGSALSAPSAAPASALKGIGGGIGGAMRGRTAGSADTQYYLLDSAGGRHARGLNRNAPGVPQQVQNWGFYETEESLSYPGTEDYEEVTDNAFENPLEEGYSTFSIDVDTAAYANMRRFLNGGSLPPKDAVRIEEMINYFDYDYPGPDGEVPFSASIETATCPWNKEHKLARIGLKGKEIEAEDRGPANLVFLIDVSGSMKPENKLPLLKQGLKLLVQQLEPRDRVAIVTYAGSSGLALPSTSLEQREAVLGALNTFQAGGSTNGGAGIQLAYKTAREHFEEEGINRVVLATDGDFNVGITDRNDLIGLIEREAKSGIFLSVLGFGMGNLKDGNLEGLADKGNGNYAYIDNLKEAQKVLVQQAGSTLVTIAKDVKIQVEFNPAKVGAYRLIGYENRVMPAEHFNDDTKDAGEIGAGHTVTALYEIVPKGKPINTQGVDPMRYQAQGQTAEPQNATPLAEEAESNELLNLKLRYKPPKEDVSKLIEFPVEDSDRAFADASTDLRFAASVASFGMILRDSPYKGGSSFDSILEIARSSRGEDEHGYRSEFVQLVELAKALQ